MLNLSKMMQTQCGFVKSCLLKLFVGENVENILKCLFYLLCSNDCSRHISILMPSGPLEGDIKLTVQPHITTRLETIIQYILRLSGFNAQFTLYFVFLSRQRAED